jgi:hypothetical protein
MITEPLSTVVRFACTLAETTTSPSLDVVVEVVLELLMVDVSTTLTFELRLVNIV